MKFDYSKVLILGYGESGRSVESVLKDKNIDYLIYDKNIKHSDSVFINKINKKILRTVDIAVLSPGISIYSDIVKKILKHGIKVISEIEFGYYFCKARIIAVTGTNGKTTTASMIYHILKSSGINVALMGNIGTAFSNIYNIDVDVVVVEVRMKLFLRQKRDLHHMSIMKMVR